MTKLRVNKIQSSKKDNENFMFTVCLLADFLKVIQKNLHIGTRELNMSKIVTNYEVGLSPDQT